MTIRMSTYDCWELFEQANPNPQGCDRSHPSDIIWNYPSQLGQGYYRMISLGTGLEIEICEFEYSEDVIVDWHSHQSNLEFVSRISGNSYGSDGSITNPGQDYIFGGVYEDGGFGANCAGKTLEICIHIQPETLRTLLEDYSEAIPKELEKAIEREPEQPFFNPGILSPAKRMALHQILTCPFQDLPRKMYLDGLARELIALKLASTVPDEQKRDRPSIVRRQEVEKIHYAAYLLVRDLENPASLVDLAQQVGLSQSKLKQGFQQVFGTTVFAYLQRHRLEWARQLLTDRTLTIFEVAHTVGYTSQSRFAAAFKRQFGRTPKAYQLSL